MSRATHVTNRTAQNWNDLRCPATSAVAFGANAPQFEIIRNNDGAGVDKSLRFQGNQYMYIPSNSAYTIGNTDAKSIAFWFRPDSTQLGSLFRIAFRSGCWGIRAAKSGSTWRLQIFVDGNPYENLIDFSLGQRHQIILGMTSVSGVITFTLYFDNVQIYQRTVAKVANNQRVYFGGNDVTWDYFGLIDEIDFYQGDVTQNATVRNGLWNSGNGVLVPPEDPGNGVTVISDWECNQVVSFTTPDEKGLNSIVLGDGAGLNAPTLDNQGLIVTTSSIGVFSYKFFPNVRSDLFFTAQLSHGYLTESILRPHLHFMFLDDTPGNIVWGVELWGAGILQKFPAATTILQSTVGYEETFRHEIAPFGDYGGFPTKSSQILIRVFRDGDNPLDTYEGIAAFFEFDFHELRDRVGTLKEFPGAGA